MRIFHHLFGTFGGIGHIPVVPATWTSLAVALIYGVAGQGSDLSRLPVQALVLLGCVITGVIACGGLERQYGLDPKQATMDEAAGMVITLMAVPLRWPVVLVGFVLFRIFDVIKLWPARRLERLPGGWGIMADDLAAGIHARIVLAILLLLDLPYLS
jgi:phosphatidylglycerophosphatase A